METQDNEEERLKSVALQNARSILQARRRAEDELRKQSEWLRVTLFSIGDAVISTDAEGRVMFMNVVAESLTGWSQAEALGHPLQDVFSIVDEQSRKPVEDPALRALREGTTVGLANRTILIAKDGTEKQIDDSASPIRSNQGEIIGSVLIFRDISERHRADSRLRESEMRYRTLFESMREGFCIIEVIFDEQEKAVDYRFLEVNPAFEQQTGLKNATGKRMRELVPAHEQEWFDTYGRVALTGEPIQFERRAEGLSRWFEVSATRLNPAESRRVGIVFSDVTQRRRDEERLRENAARFDLVKDATQVGFWFCDLPFDILNWDARVKEHFWLPVDGQVRIETFYDRLHPHDRERTRQAIAASIADKTRYDIEYRTVASDGREKWIRAIGRTFYDGRGKPIRFDGVTLDISERKQTEEAPARLAAIVDSSDDAIVSKTLNGIITSWNKGAERLLGYRADEMIGQPVTTIIPPDRQNEEMEILARLRREERVEHFETVRLAKDGRLIELSLSISPVRDSAGRIIGAAKIARDITERKRAEELLRASEERFRALVSQATAGICQADVRGRFTFANDRYCEILGYSRQELMRKRILDITEMSFVPRYLHLYQRLWRDGVPFTVEVQYLGKGGSRVWVSNSVAPVLNKNGDTESAVCVTLDITKRKQSEEALVVAQEKLEEHAALLETRVVERTSELGAMNEHLEAFVYSIAHDLRAPLRSMTSFSQLLIADHASGLNEDGQDMLRRIQTASEFMDRLLLDLLAFGRVGRTEMNLDSVEVLQAWDAALFQTAAQAEQTKARIEVLGSLPTVRAHEATLGQCLTNLLSNAMKFIAPGVQPHIRFWSEELGAPRPPTNSRSGRRKVPERQARGAMVRLWLEDNGIGIAPQHQERSFRVFERLNGARYPGTGIGLSIVRKGIQRMGGKIGLESEPGKGSRFWIDLPKVD